MRVLIACTFMVVALATAPALAQSSSRTCPKPGCGPAGVPHGVPAHQVPEPGAMLIFAAGAGWLLRRQARARG